MVMGAQATAGDLGAALGPLVAYALADAAGLRWAYALAAALIACTLPALTARRPPRIRSIR